ncbi:MAG: hypothetical protein NWE76_04080 [Candidatus Bathyarchaeota archaeon]|nr:hypothetical protein [Candidatus Bathyarchaeota archaeon]
MLGAVASLAGHELLFQKKLLDSIALFVLSISSSVVAGLVTGAFFMEKTVLGRWGGVMAGAGLPATAAL